MTRPWLTETPFAVFDLETTGLDREADHVVQIAVASVDGGEIVDEWSTLVRPPVSIPSEVSVIHGITDDDVRDAPTFGDIAVPFLNKIRGRGLVGYNAASFDLPFVCAELLRCGLQIRPERAAIDPLTWIRSADRYVPGKGRHRLVATCERWGVPINGPAHDALVDVRACWNLFAEIVRRSPSRFPVHIAEVIARQGRMALMNERRFQAWLAAQPPLEPERNVALGGGA